MTPPTAPFSEIPSPALVFDLDKIAANITALVDMIDGRTDLLRPHMKTHKCGQLLKLQQERGITKVKAATLKEAEVAAQSGVPDVLVSYPLQGPSTTAFAGLAQQYPGTTFSTVIDSPEGAAALSQAAKNAGITLNLFLDLDCGMQRTGIRPGPAAVALIQTILNDTSLHFAGIHAYDGHIHAPGIDERDSAFQEAMARVDEMLSLLASQDITVPRIVAGGSPTYAWHAARALKSDIPWECSPGTPLLWDAGYGESHPEMPFVPAAFLLTRVISHPGDQRICLDLGYKAVASENLLERRVRFPSISDYRCLGQSEEHLVLEVADPAAYPIGSIHLGIPIHVCPTVALHARAHVIQGDTLCPQAWSIDARDRYLP